MCSFDLVSGGLFTRVLAGPILILDCMAPWQLGVSQPTPVLLFIDRVLWVSVMGQWGMLDYPGLARFSGLFTDVLDSFYYLHTFLALGNPDRAGSISHVHTATLSPTEGSLCTWSSHIVMGFIEKRRHVELLFSAIYLHVALFTTQFADLF